MFSQSDTFEALQKPINKIELIIRDPLLSEFKYHFIIKKLHIYNIINQNFRWNEFIISMYKGFNAHYMGHNSIHIVQILAQYPQTGQVDIIVGLRRDQHALKFYRQIHIFQYQGNKYQIQVAEGFKTYLDELNQKYRKQAAQHERIKAEQNRHQMGVLNPQAQNLSSSKEIQEAQKQVILPEQKSRSIIQMSPEAKVSRAGSEQFQITLTGKKSNFKKRSSSSSSGSRSYSSYSKSKKKSVSNSSYSSRQSRHNNNSKSQYDKNKMQKRRNSSSSSRKSRNSQDSRNVQNKRYTNVRDRRRNDRSRQRKYYRKQSSSSSSSRSSNNKSKRYSRYSPSQQKKKQYREERDRRYQENRKYEIYPAYNRSYSNNYDRYRDLPSQMTKKYSYETYNSFRPNPVTVRPDSNSMFFQHNKQSNGQGYGYYKPGQDHPPYPKPNVGQFQPKFPTNNVPFPKYSDNSAYKYMPGKNSYYTKNQTFYQ